MAKLTIAGTVVANVPTRQGAWHRLMLSAGGRVNDLVMVPAGSPEAATEVGTEVALDVRAQVETTAEGRPTRAIVYWIDGPREVRAGRRERGEVGQGAA